MKTAVVLMNLGSPVEPTLKAVRAFLREFLSDPRVIEIPRIFWMVILYVFILTFRTPRSCRAYRKIWWPEGSPLRVISLRQAEKLQKQINSQWGQQAPIIRFAMTYSGPSLEQVVSELEAQSVEHILVLPLYPQFSATTTGSIYDQVARINQKRRNIPQIHIIKQYYDDPLYIEALAASVKKCRIEEGVFDRLLMSFHSIPQRYSDAGDPYYSQCKTTAELLANKLELTPDQWAISFQSRLGFSKWLSPYTAVVLKSWGQKRIESVAVICPAFAADCLETLEEIAVENRELFQQQGGGRFYSIPCLNDQPDHIQMMMSLIEKYLPRIK
jgi:ferrochelatase